jgi:hypothetical protein
MYDDTDAQESQTDDEPSERTKQSLAELTKIQSQFVSSSATSSRHGPRSSSKQIKQLKRSQKQSISHELSEVRTTVARRNKYYNQLKEKVAMQDDDRHEKTADLQVSANTNPRPQNAYGEQMDLMDSNAGIFD